MHLRHAPNGRIGGYPTLYYNMMLAALLGLVHGPLDEAECLASAVEATLTDAGPFQLHRAVAASLGQYPGESLQTLRSAQHEHPDDTGLTLALAAALLRAGDEDWRSLVDGVLAVSIEPNERRAAQGLLALAELASG